MKSRITKNPFERKQKGTAIALGIIHLLFFIAAGCAKQSSVEDEKFCSNVNVENIDKTIPLINDFLKNLSNDLDNETKLQDLAAWLKAKPCIIDANVTCNFCIKTQPKTGEITVSFDEDENTKNFILSISLTYPLKVANFIEIQNMTCTCEEDKPVTSSSKDFFNYLGGEKRYFEISSNKIIVKVDDKMTEKDIENSLRKNSSLQVCEILKLGNREFQFLVCFKNTDRNEIKQLVNQWKSNDTILYIGHVIIDEEGKKTAALTNQINVMLKGDKDFSILQNALFSYDIEKVEQYEFDSRIYLLIVNYFSKKSALQIANELHETGLFEFASPNLLTFIRYGI